MECLELHCANLGLLQGARIRFVLGCVIARAGAVARSRNLGQALFGSPVAPLGREEKAQLVGPRCTTKCIFDMTGSASAGHNKLP